MRRDEGPIFRAFAERYGWEADVVARLTDGQIEMYLGVGKTAPDLFTAVWSQRQRCTLCDRYHGTKAAACEKCGGPLRRFTSAEVRVERKRAAAERPAKGSRGGKGRRGVR